MGTFHTICNLLSIIGKRFSDAGLRDVAVETGLIAEGSISSVLEGRQYNRDVSLHKILYEAFLRLSWKGFVSWVKENHSSCLPMIESLLTEVEEQSTKLEHQLLTTFLENNDFKKIVDVKRRLYYYRA